MKKTYFDSSEIKFSAVRSRGPGGQNVNKVNSAALLKWNFRRSYYLSDQQKDKLASKLSNCINKNEQIFLRCDEFRDLERNKDRCLQKLQNMVRRALTPVKKRKKTKPTKGSIEKRLQEKKLRSKLKQTRQKSRHDL